MHYNFACLSSKLLLFFVFFNIWVQETMWRKIEGNPASELPWEQSSWSLKTRSAAGVCVCVWSMACFFLCISMNFILLLFSSFCKKCVFVSACLCEVSQAGFSLQKFPTAVSLFIFFSYSWIVSHGSQSVWKSFTPDLSVIIFFFLCYNNID